MSTVNVQRRNETTNLIDQYRNTNLTVSTHEYDIVIAFFKKIMVDTGIAEVFAANLFTIAKDTGVPVLTYLETLKNQNALQITMTMAYYLNNTRSNTTLLGIGKIITPNYYAARNVVI